MRIAEFHQPDPKRVQSRCRVDCICGWRGPLVAMYGEGQRAWVDHFRDEQRAAKANRS